MQDDQRDIPITDVNPSAQNQKHQQHLVDTRKIREEISIPYPMVRYLVNPFPLLSFLELPHNFRHLAYPYHESVLLLACVLCRRPPCRRKDIRLSDALVTPQPDIGIITTIRITRVGQKEEQQQEKEQ